MNAYELRKRKDMAPYNDNMEDACQIYDNLFYTMDVDLCPKNEHRLVSGNVIKGFRCIVDNVYTVPLKQ